VADVAEAALRYARYRAAPAKAVAALTRAGTGDADVPADLRVLARKVDRGLGLVGVRCLGRAVVVAQMLRRRGLPAGLAITVDPANPRDAHAEPAVGEWTLRATEPGHRRLR
jgi:hypothetical protein